VVTVSPSLAVPCYLAEGLLAYDTRERPATVYRGDGETPLLMVEVGMEGLGPTYQLTFAAHDDGHAVLIPRGALSDDTVEETTSAGALAVLVDGPLPAGAFSLDVPAGVPVVGLTGDVVAEMRTMIAEGIPVTVAIGDVEVARREEGGSIAAFSSRGLVLDGSLKPSLAAPGVSVPTSEPGRGDDGDVRFGTISGTSAAAAVTAGVAALLAQGRPSLDARALQGVLVGSAQRADLDPTASGAGVIDLRAAVQQEAFAQPSLLSFGAAGKSGVERTLRITNVSTRALAVSIGNTGCCNSSYSWFDAILIFEYFSKFIDFFYRQVYQFFCKFLKICHFYLI
jgi:hypothetical protein